MRFRSFASILVALATTIVIGPVGGAGAQASTTVMSQGDADVGNRTVEVVQAVPVTPRQRKSIKRYGCDTDPATAQNTYVRVCFVPKTNRVYIQDREADGRAAIGRTHGLFNGHMKNCTWSGGNGTWGSCLTAVPEGGVVYQRGYVWNKSTGYKGKHTAVGIEDNNGDPV